MPIRRATLACLAALLALPACGGGGSAGDTRTPQSVPIDHHLDLPYRKPVLLTPESLQLTLVAVRDSRCPAGVQCVWAGAAEVDIEVSLPGVVPEVKTITLPLLNADGSKGTATLRDYRLTLDGLLPTPPRTTTQATDYLAQLHLERPVP